MSSHQRYLKCVYNTVVNYTTTDEFNNRIIGKYKILIIGIFII